MVLKVRLPEPFAHYYPVLQTFEEARREPSSHLFISLQVHLLHELNTP